MVINRHNYEEFFLLYIDGELPASDRQMVELFVQQNTDLAGELELLLHTKLERDDTDVIPDKDSLYRHTDCSIDEANCEEKFLLYIDNELSKDEKNEVDTFLLQHPGKQKNFAGLMQTKLVPEKVIFTNKEVLYKKRKPAVLFIGLARIAVAAIFIGLLVGIWSLHPYKIAKAKSSLTVISHPTKTTPNIPDIVTNRQPGTTTGFIIPEIITTTKKKKATREPKQVIIPTLPAQDTFIAATKKEKLSLDILDINEKEAAVAMVKPDIRTNDKQDIDPPNSQQLHNISIGTDNGQKKLTQKTVYKELDTEDANKNNNIYVGNFQINKYKLAGLLKRASHIFSKAPDNENNIAIANFTINKSLR